MCKLLEMTENQKLNQKLKLFLSLEVYLSLLDLAPKSKQEHRKAILDFLCLLFSRDKNSPVEKDYDDYGYYLQILRKKSITTKESAISYAKRFFSWLSENSECINIETLNTLPEQRPRRKRTRRVNTLLSPYLYENLELLANEEGTDIPTKLNAIVAQYIARRKSNV